VVGKKKNGMVLEAPATSCCSAGAKTGPLEITLMEAGERRK